MADGSNGTLDLRGEFIRAWDAGRGLDSGRTLGSVQTDAIRNITGRTNNMRDADAAGGSPYGAFYSNAFMTGAGGSGDSAAQNFTTYFDASRVVPTANENRPHNIALIACKMLN